MIRLPAMVPLFLALLSPLVFLPAAHDPYFFTKALWVRLCAFLALAALPFWRRAMGRNTLRAFWPMILLLLASTASLAANQTTEHQWARFVDICSYGILALAGAGILQRKSQYEHFLAAILIATGGTALIALYQMSQMNPPVVALFGHPNFLGQYLAAVMPFLFSCVVLHEKRNLRLVCFFILVVFSAVLAGNVLRGAMIGAIAGMAVVARLATGHRKEQRRKAFAAFFVLVVVGLIVLAAGLGDAKKKAAAAADLRGPTLADSNLKDRFLMWSATLDMVADRPLLGFAPGGFERHFPDYRHPIQGQSRRVMRAAHNDYLHLATEVGIPAACIFFSWMIIVVFGSGRRLLRHKDRDESPWFRIGIIGGLAGSLAHMFFSFNLENSASATLIFVFAGILSADTTTTEMDERYKPNLIRSLRWRIVTLALCVFLAMAGMWIFVYRPLLAEMEYKKGAGLLSQQQTKQAIGLLEQAAENAPFRWDLLTDLAVAYKDEKQFEEASKAIRQARKQIPGYAQLSYLEGNILVQSDRLQTAVEPLLHSIHRNPQYAPAWNLLGYVFYSQGAIRASKFAFETAILLSPGNSEKYRQNLRRIQILESNKKNPDM